jgi:uncharacterized membrane protein YccC
LKAESAMSFLTKLQRVSATVLEGASAAAERAARQAEQKGHPNAGAALSQALNMKSYAQDLRAQALSQEEAERLSQEQAQADAEAAQACETASTDEASTPAPNPEPMLADTAAPPTPSPGPQAP